LWLAKTVSLFRREFRHSAATDFFVFLKRKRVFRKIRKRSFQIAVTRSFAIRASKAAPSQDVGT
jgi:hypothetical protein